MSATRPPSFDERYAAPVEASRRGAHRARPNPLAALLPVVAGVVVVLLVVGGAWALLGDNGSPGTSAGVAAAPTETRPVPSGSPSASAAPSASASSEAPEPSESASAGGEVDHTVELRVLSSVNVAGTARKAAAALKDKDWSVGEVGNANQRNLETTRVYYARSPDKATAEAIVDDLGYGETKKSAANAGDTGITVVLGKDALDD